MTETPSIEILGNIKQETEQIDFKREFVPSSKGSYCEIIKDVVALANSGGGAILIGLDDFGVCCPFEEEALRVLDSADVANKIHTYTGKHFASFELKWINRGSKYCFAILVHATDVPLIFIKDGAYSDVKGKERFAFRKGVIYFRHGTKSEPGHSDDLIKWRDRSLDKIRKNWMEGVVKVVETSGLGEISVFNSNETTSNVRFTSDPNAPAARPTNLDESHPFRENQLVEYVLERANGLKKFSGHDVRCIKLNYKISPETRPDFTVKPHAIASPQYSPEFGSWIVSEIDSKPDFISDARQAFKNNGNKYTF